MLKYLKELSGHFSSEIMLNCYNPQQLYVTCCLLYINSRNSHIQISILCIQKTSPVHKPFYRSGFIPLIKQKHIKTHLNLNHVQQPSYKSSTRHREIKAQEQRKYFSCLFPPALCFPLTPSYLWLSYL